MNTFLTILGLAIMFGGIYIIGPKLDSKIDKKSVKTSTWVPVAIDGQTGDVIMKKEK